MIPEITVTKLFAVAAIAGTLMSFSSESNHTLPVEGKYRWVFEIPGKGAQTSVHDFRKSSVVYTMQGSAYNVEYAMNVLDYNRELNRVILKGAEGSPKAGRFFAIFLKNVTEDAVTMYKKEFASLEEALVFPLPSESDTESHGWNRYLKFRQD